MVGDYVDSSYGSFQANVSNNKLNFEMTLLKTFPTDTIQDIKMMRLTSKGTYENMGVPMSINVCTYLKTDKMFYAAIKNLKNTKLPDNCPVQEGSYYFYNFDVNDADMPMIIQPGQYRAEVVYRTQNKLIAKLYYHCKIVRI